MKKGSLTIGDLILAEVDEEKRLATMRNHSATHLLQGALKRVVGKHITQSGSYVSPDTLRFDFTHLEAISKSDLKKIEKLVNDEIMKNLPITKTVMSLDEARKTGAIAPFGEKYGEQVRVIKMGDFSIEFCGGTHLDFTGQIGPFVLISESSIASGIRRIEALTGTNAVIFIQQQLSIITEMSNVLSSISHEIPVRVESLQKELKQMRLECEKLRSKASESSIENVMGSPKVVSGVNVIAHKIEGVTMKELRNSADIIRGKMRNTIAVLGSEKDGKLAIIAVATGDIQDKIPADKVAKKVAEIVGGSGGGRPDLAQAGGKFPEKLDNALAAVEDIVANMLK